MMKKTRLTCTFKRYKMLSILLREWSISHLSYPPLPICVYRILLYSIVFYCIILYTYRCILSSKDKVQ